MIISVSLDDIKKLLLQNHFEMKEWREVTHLYPKDGGLISVYGNGTAEISGKPSVDIAQFFSELRCLEAMKAAPMSTAISDLFVFDLTLNNVDDIFD